MLIYINRTVNENSQDFKVNYTIGTMYYSAFVKAELLLVGGN